jgi:uncharacterized membrane protein YphA (DoxX/SURF4 family)
MQTMKRLAEPITEPNPKIDHTVIGLMRIVLGLLWLANLEWKRPPDFGETSGFGLFKYISSAGKAPAFEWWGWIVRELILPNYQLFGWVTLLSEITLAALLLLGYKTRLIALVGAAQSAAIFLSVVNYEKTEEWPWSYFLMIAMHLLVFACSAGMYLGLDGVIARGADRLAQLCLGLVAIVVGIVGFIASRSVGFTAKQGVRIGNDNWELKLLWFNRLSALLTVVLGVAVVGIWQLKRRRSDNLIPAAAFGLLAIFQLATTKFNSDGGAFDFEGGLLGGNGTTVAFWAMLAVGLGVLGLRGRRIRSEVAEAVRGSFPDATPLDG